MARNVPERIKTKGGHSPRARIHAAWSPIGQKMRRTAMLRGLGAVLAVLLVIGLAADAYAQSFFDSLPSIQGLDSAAFAGDTLITDSSGKTVLADVGNHGDHRLAVKLKDVSPVAVQATVAIEDKGFYTNPGIDFQGIVRAAFDNIRPGLEARPGAVGDARRPAAGADGMEPRAPPRPGQAPPDRGLARDGPVQLHLARRHGQGACRKAELLRAGQQIQGAALRRLRARRAAAARLPAGDPAAERENHPRLDHAAGRRGDGCEQHVTHRLQRSSQQLRL